MSVRWMRAALIAALAVGSSCAVVESAPHAVTANHGTSLGSSITPEFEELERTPAAFTEGESAPRAPLVLLTIDGARWQEIFEGSDAELGHGPKRSARELLPNLDRLAHVSGAALGAPGHGIIRATGPSFVSLPGYTEILTGRAPIRCQDNTCGTITTATILDDAHAAGASVAVFGSWEMLDHAVSARPGSFPVSCGRHGDETIDPYPGSGDFRPDRLTAELALRHLVEKQPDVLYISLGEPDEYGHRGDYAGYLRALVFADGVVGRIMATLEHLGPRGAATHVVVTADHGRARDFKGHGAGAPESARVWLVMSGPAIGARGYVTASTERHLADIAPTMRVLLGLTPDRVRHHDRDRGWRGEALGELDLQFAESHAHEAQAFASPIGQDTPVPPSPQ